MCPRPIIHILGVLRWAPARPLSLLKVIGGSSEGMTRYAQYIPMCAAAAFCLLVAPVLTLVSAPVQAGGPLIVVASPRTDLTAIVEKSGGWVVGVTRAPLAIMGFSESEDFEQRLRQNGAWAILDGETLAWLCGVKI